MNEASAHLQGRNDPQSKTLQGQDILLHLEDENFEVMEMDVLHKRGVLGMSVLQFCI